eukprot:TRINITY_DN3681_c1_g1_i4.p2 TRINITY_DN3681_c1_g1~~TRINITY_DN3681_c1_g1_i4.p2  ORF type:complete len:108 (+),score=23.63 TRINITY_DN3681_c1_g1_i4:294-617(+)
MRISLTDFVFISQGMVDDKQKWNFFDVYGYQQSFLLFLASQYTKEEHGIQCLALPLVDDRTQDIQHTFEESVEFIDQFLEKDKKVLVHCKHNPLPCTIHDSDCTCVC